MSDFDYGPVQTYEITWRSGHVERVLAHQVTWPQQGLFLAAGNLLPHAAAAGRSRMHFHAHIDGRWLLTLAADEEDILSIRLVTEAEPIPAVEGS